MDGDQDTPRTLIRGVLVHNDPSATVVVPERTRSWVRPGKNKLTGSLRRKSSGDSETPRTLIQQYVANHETAFPATRSKSRVDSPSKAHQSLDISQAKSSPRSPRSPRNAKFKQPTGSLLRKKVTVKHFLQQESSSDERTPRTTIKQFLDQANEETPLVSGVSEAARDDDGSSDHSLQSAPVGKRRSIKEASFLSNYDVAPAAKRNIRSTTTSKGREDIVDRLAQGVNENSEVLAANEESSLVPRVSEAARDDDGSSDHSLPSAPVRKRRSTGEASFLSDNDVAPPAKRNIRSQTTSKEREDIVDRLAQGVNENSEVPAANEESSLVPRVSEAARDDDGSSDHSLPSAPVRKRRSTGEGSFLSDDDVAPPAKRYIRSQATSKEREDIVDRLAQGVNENSEVLTETSLREDATGGLLDSIPEDTVGKKDAIQEDKAGGSGSEAQRPNPVESQSRQDITLTDISYTDKTTSTLELTRPGYDHMVTPALPQARKIPTSMLEVPKTPKNTDKADRLVVKPAVQNRARRPTKPSNTPLRLPSSLTKSIFSHFSRSRVSRQALQEVEKAADAFWKNTVEDVSVYANHANRKTIEVADVELLMRRQRFITEKQSMFTLVEKYLPLEYRQEIIPIARSGNKLEPKS